MKLFWIIVAVMALAGIGFLALGGRGSGSAGRGPSPVAPTAPSPSLAPAPASPAQPAAQAAAPAPERRPSLPPPAVAPPGGRFTDATPPPTAPPSAPPVPPAPLTAEETPPHTPPPAAQAAMTPPVAASSDGASSSLEGFTVIPGTIKRNDDGTIVLDDRFVISGEGSVENPYRITWDLLVSAEETFNPENGKRSLPQRLAMLHGKRVRIDGWIAFPLMAAQPRELLAMLNQWDGCCLGVPPTPYDAIEVKLRQVVAGDDRFANQGGVEGRLEIKPYLVGDWLVGLYVLEDSAFAPSGFGANPATHGAAPVTP